MLPTARDANIAVLRRSDGVEVFDVYFAWKFRITDLPLFMISSFKR